MASVKPKKTIVVVILEFVALLAIVVATYMERWVASYVNKQINKIEGLQIDKPEGGLDNNFYRFKRSISRYYGPYYLMVPTI